MPLNVLDVIELGRKGIQDVNNENLPVSFPFIQQCHNTEDLDLLHLTNVCHLFTNLANIKRVIVALCLRFRMLNIRVFPCLDGIMHSNQFVGGHLRCALTWGKAP